MLLLRAEDPTGVSHTVLGLKPQFAGVLRASAPSKGGGGSGERGSSASCHKVTPGESYAVQPLDLPSLGLLPVAMF